MISRFPKYILNSPTILITGETGVGKSLAARQIYQTSHKYSSKFVTVHLASLNEELIESELYGHERGAFTGAISRKLGSVELAGTGTLFLDEVGELSLEGQKRLLYLLEERKFSPVGSSKEIRFSGRIICATNCDLQKMVEKGRFRKDLYFRLLISEYRLSSLSERRDQILPIAREISREMANSFGGEEVQLAHDLRSFMQSYHWPGNIRELKNLIEYLHHKECHYARMGDLPKWIVANDTIQNVDLDGDDGNLGYYNALKSFEKNYLESALNRFSGAVNRTAKEIGISKSTLIAKSRKYGINTWQIKANSIENIMRVA